VAKGEFPSRSQMGLVQYKKHLEELVSFQNPNHCEGEVMVMQVATIRTLLSGSAHKK
jgi:hypothetical protein